MPACHVLRASKLDARSNFHALRILSAFSRDYAKPNTVHTAGGTHLRMWHLPYVAACGLKGVVEPVLSLRLEFCVGSGSGYGLLTNRCFMYCLPSQDAHLNLCELIIANGRLASI